jgi:DNA-binding beta-propeller fold protein YncE
MGSWPAAFQLPAGIAIDEIDRIYVADQLNSRIQVFQYLKEQ